MKTYSDIMISAQAGRTVRERTTGGVIGVASDNEDSSGDEDE